MKSIRLIWIGKSRESFAKDGVAFYRERLKPYFPVEVIELRGADHSGRDSAQALKLEGDQLIRQIDDRDYLILLDERGKQWGSREFSQRLEKRMESEPGPLTMVLGGAWGVDDRVRERANETMALSKMTFPHQLVRVILLEQLYRAATLMAGSGYHHD